MERCNWNTAVNIHLRIFLIYCCAELKFHCHFKERGLYSLIWLCQRRSPKGEVNKILNNNDSFFYIKKRMGEEEHIYVRVIE